MNPKEKSTKEILLEQAGVLFKWKNLGKTAASTVPFVSELIDQLEDHELDGRLTTIEQELAAASELHKLERAASPPPPPPHDWPSSVAEYSRRLVDFAVVYDSGFHSRTDRGRELVQPVAHACVTGENEVIAAREALEFASDIAQAKHGRLIILAGMAWYAFEPGAADGASGLVLCKLTGRDEEKWEEWATLRRKYNLDNISGDLIKAPIRYSVGPFLGQELGFIHTGEATNVRRGPDDFSRRQFDTGVLSHFRRPRRGAFKMFVTSVLPGRVLYTGAPVFTRDGTLLGLLADIETYNSDAGRRAVARSLLGHPRFAKKENRP